MKALPFRWRAFGWHFLGTGIAAVSAWLLATQLWFPWPLATLAGGMQLFPDRHRRRRGAGPPASRPSSPTRPSRSASSCATWPSSWCCSSRRFGYGIYTLAAARPVLLAFEVDLFRVVSAAEVDMPTLPQAPPAYRSLPWTGPVTLAAIKPDDQAEIMRTIELGLAGIPLAALPAYWRDYASEQTRAWAKAQPLTAAAIARAPDPAEIERIAAKAGVTALRASCAAACWPAAPRAPCCWRRPTRASSASCQWPFCPDFKARRRRMGRPGRS